MPDNSCHPMAGFALPKPEKRGPKPRKPILRSAPPRRSAKRLPRVTQTERGKEESRLNALFSRVIRSRMPYCRFAVRHPDELRPATDAAHLFPKGAYPRLRWDLRNAVGACRECHDYMGANKAELDAFMRLRLNVREREDLMRIHLVGPSPDRAVVRMTLTAALAQFRRAA